MRRGLTVESYLYDNNGNVRQVTDRKNQVTTYTYDALNRLTQVAYADSSTTSYTYDAGDRLTQVTDSLAGTITRAYDLLDRLTSETTPEGTVSYTYDAAGRRATMTVGGQTGVSYAYDNAGRLTAITQGSANVSFTYDNANRPTSVTLPIGVVMEYGYSSDSRLTGINYKLGAQTLGTLTYGYDANGQPTEIGGTYARTGLPVALTSATYDNANQIATFGGTTFEYDPNGNLTNDGTTMYSWNVRNQLNGLSGGSLASFQYDGLGRRRSKTINGTTTAFLYDGLNLVQELSGGTPSANLLPGPRLDEVFQRTDAAGSRGFLNDALGSTLALADGSGTVQTSYTYEPFGGTTVAGNPSTSTTQFTGRENDGTGLYFLRARYYNPRLQRFVSEDPIGSAGGINLFIYASNEPTLLVDRLGLKPQPGFPLLLWPGGPGPRRYPSSPPLILPRPPVPAAPLPSPSEPPEEDKPCDPSCVSDCVTKLNWCLAAWGFAVGIMDSSVVLGCAAAGPAGAAACFALAEPGLSWANYIVWGGGLSACFATYELNMRRCGGCTQ